MRALYASAIEENDGTRASSLAIPAPRRTRAPLVTCAAVPWEARSTGHLDRVSGRLRVGYQAERPRNAKTSARGTESAAASTIENAPGRARNAVRTAARGTEAA